MVYSLSFQRRFDAETDVITKAAFRPQLFKDPECWSGWGFKRDLPHCSPLFKQLSQPVSGIQIGILELFNQFIHNFETGKK